MQVPDPIVLQSSNGLIYAVVVACLGIMANFSINLFKLLADRKEKGTNAHAVRPISQELENKIREAITFQSINHAAAIDKLDILQEGLDRSNEKIESALGRQADALERYFQRVNDLIASNSHTSKRLRQ